MVRTGPITVEIPAAPETAWLHNCYCPPLVDGLGFRHFWATEVADEDLLFKPPEEARTSFETIQHIYGLTQGLTSIRLRAKPARTKQCQSDHF